MRESVTDNCQPTLLAADPTEQEHFTGTAIKVSEANLACAVHATNGQERAVKLMLVALFVAVALTCCEADRETLKASSHRRLGARGIWKHPQSRRTTLGAQMLELGEVPSGAHAPEHTCSCDAQ